MNKIWDPIPIEIALKKYYTHILHAYALKFAVHMVDQTNKQCDLAVSVLQVSRMCV